tara:strand:- start:106 stop:858 length:753 start_codon:yes stop_codon:yes gene_type:complete
LIKYIQIGLINNVFSMKYKFSIIIPTYNEKKNLEHLINIIKKNLKKLIYEIIIVDDNSNDGSKNILKNIKSKNKKFNYFIRKNNKKDLCKSVIIGITKVKYENIIIMDGDLQHNPKYLPKICKIFSKKNIDFLVCSRNFKKRYGLSFIRYYFSKALIFFVNFILGKKVNDPMSGFFIFKKNFFILNKRNLYTNGFKILLNLLYSTKKKMKIYEQTIVFEKRFNNKSKMNYKVLYHIIISIFYYFYLNFIK